MIYRAQQTYLADIGSGESHLCRVSGRGKKKAVRDVVLVL